MCPTDCYVFEGQNQKYRDAKLLLVLNYVILPGKIT